MSYGANIYTEAGQLAYSTDYPVYQFVGVFRLAIDSNYAGQSFSIISDYAPVVFCKPYPAGSNNVVVSHSMYFSAPNIWTISAGSSGTFNWTPVNNSTGGYPNQIVQQVSGSYVDVLVFVRPRNWDAETGYGMNVYDSSGKLSFTSKMKPLKISGYHDTISQGGSTYANAEPYYSPETITGGTIPSNWAACVGDLGVARKSTTTSAYYNFNGNQGMVYFQLGAGRADSTTVMFDESKFITFVPPGISGQYPNYSKKGGRRILFLDADAYSTPVYNLADWAPITGFLDRMIPYGYFGSMKITVPSFNGSPTATALMSTGNYIYGSFYTSGRTIFYTANSLHAGNDGGVTFRAKAVNEWSLPFEVYFPMGDPDIDIAETVLPSGSLGVPYNYTLTPTGASTIAPYIWWDDGSWTGDYPMPPGLSVDQNTGTISGTPTSRGTYTILMKVRDNTFIPGVRAWYINSKFLTITIN